MVRVSEAILITSLPQLAVAVAALTSGSLDPTATTVVVVSPSDAAEVQTEVIDAARRAAQRHGWRLVHLNDVLAPFHPLGWRAADLDASQFAAAWAAAGGPATLAVLHCFGAGDSAQRGLARVFGARRRRIADTATEAGVALRRAGEPRLVAGGGAGLAVMIRLRGAHLTQIPDRRIALAEAELGLSGPARTSISLRRPDLWRGLIRGREEQAQAGATAAVIADGGEPALDFVRRSIEELDARRQYGSERPD